MDDTPARPRCLVCGRGIPFADWRRGIEWCAACDPLAELVAADPAATFSRDHARPSAVAASVPRATAFPDALIDELVAALEREERLTLAPAPANGFGGLLAELGVGSSPDELPWAAWGFALGFGANVVLAKYVQMVSGGSFAEFLPPMLLGGVVAGLACAGIGWGIARLRDRSA